jgi:uncharacterized protein (DUF983 family)
MAGLVNALRARCPVCGDKRIWKSFGQTVEECPRCGYRYEREEGYWVGGLIVAIGIAMTVFFLILAGGLLLTWPDVPWTALLVVTLVAMALFPIALYPQSKTIWVWLDLTFIHSERHPTR